MTETQDKIVEACESLRELLIYKNERYGDSALNPAGVFARDIPAEAAIRIRLDDKIKRVMNGSELRKNDTADIMGYLVLLCIARGWTNFDEMMD